LLRGINRRISEMRGGGAAMARYFFTRDFSGLTSCQTNEKASTRQVSQAYRLPYQRPRP